jgi:hypothetical protein
MRLSLSQSGRFKRLGHLEVSWPWESHLGSRPVWPQTTPSSHAQAFSLVTHRRTLLILDGLEPLQNPTGPLEGRLREPCLRALLRELAAFEKGLCIVTTRTPIADIADHERTSAPSARPGPTIQRGRGAVAPSAGRKG